MVELIIITILTAALNVHVNGSQWDIVTTKTKSGKVIKTELRIAKGKRK